MTAGEARRAPARLGARPAGPAGESTYFPTKTRSPKRDVCPSYIRQQTTWTYNLHVFPLMPWYGMNPNLHYGPIAMAAVRLPAQMIMLADSCHPMGADWRFAWPRAPSVLPGSGNPCTVVTNTAAQADSTLHNMGSNIAFADGHAKWLVGSDIYANRATYMPR